MRQQTAESYHKLLQLAEQGRTVNTLSLVSGPPKVAGHLGQMLLVFPDGSADGVIVDGELTRAALAHVPRPAVKPALFAFDHGGDTYRCFFDIAAPKRQAVVFGGGHISQPLVAILALMDFRVTVVDDRPDFANRARFPQATTVLCTAFAKAGEQLDLGGASAVLILTRGHRYDIECLKMALPFTPRYLGMIGSRRRVTAIMDTLLAEGEDPQRLRAVRTPVGLDISAQTPAEIAVSIAAELVAAYHGGAQYRPLSEKVFRHG